MSAAKPPSKFGLNEVVVESPIKSFPEDVGWFTAYRKPIQVHARKMGRDFVVRRPEEEDIPGHAGDYVVVIREDPMLVEASVFEDRYVASVEASTAAAPSVPSTESALTFEQKASIRAAVEAFIQHGDIEMKKVLDAMVANARELVTNLSEQRNSITTALDSSPTAPSVYACPFCIIQGLQRDEVRDHVLRDHLMHGLFGDFDKAKP
jgi:hypothetical protein